MALAAVSTLVAVNLGRLSFDGSRVQLDPFSWTGLLVALCWALGVPLLLSVWKRSQDQSGIIANMSWLPIVTNGAGLLLGALCAPSLLAQALHRSDALVAKVSGEQSSLTQAASALARDSAERLDPKSQAPSARLTKEIGQDTERVQDIKLDSKGNGVLVDLRLTGPSGSIDATYLFDTGASYTTITTAQAKKLGITLPENAPALEFNTAAGLRKSPMVYLPKLTLGEIDIHGLLVSVCDSCATPRYPGLLGINVMREFHVALDYQSRHMQLTPRRYDGPVNRAYDIEPTLKISIVGRPEVWMQHIRWTASVTNNGTQPVKDIILKVTFGKEVQVLSQPIPTLAPGETRKTVIRGRLAKKLPRSAEFTLSLASAQW